MKYLIFLFPVVLIFACHLKKTKHRAEPVLYWYDNNHNPHPPDTISSWKLKFDLPNPNDSLLASDLLRLKDTTYRVSVYTNEFNCPVDGDHRIMYVDGFGEVYYHALSWRNFGVLHSNNDSINRLISLFVAKGLQMTTERELKCSHQLLNETEQKTIHFLAPTE